MGGRDVLSRAFLVVDHLLKCRVDPCNREPFRVLSTGQISWPSPFGRISRACVGGIPPLTQSSRLGARQPQRYSTVVPPGVSTQQLRLQQASVVERGKGFQGGGFERYYRALPPFQSLALLRVAYKKTPGSTSVTRRAILTKRPTSF